MTPAPEVAAFRHRAAILTAGIVLSTGGVILRQIELADTWQILFYRSGFLVVGLSIFLTWRAHGRPFANLAAAGWAGVLGGLSLAVAMSGFVWSINHTTVANTLFILSSSPFIAAILGRLLIAERVRARTWATMVLAGLGVAVMVADGIVVGDPAGQLAALLAAVGIGGFTVILRWRRDVDLTAAMLYAGIFSMSFASLMTFSTGFSVPLTDAAWCLLYGGPVMVLGLALYAHGGRYVPAAEVALLALTEVALGPIWVWLAVDEVPAATTLVGGGVVLTAVVAQILAGGRPRRPAAPLD